MERTGNRESGRREEEEREQENGENREQGGEETKQRTSDVRLIEHPRARWCAIPRTQLVKVKGRRISARQDGGFKLFLQPLGKRK